MKINNLPFLLEGPTLSYLFHLIPKKKKKKNQRKDQGLEKEVKNKFRLHNRLNLTTNS